MTNGALDFRLLWNWLRSPIREPQVTGGATIADRLAELGSGLAEVSRSVDPYIGRDLIAV